MLGQRLLRAAAVHGSARRFSSVPLFDRNAAVAFDVDGVLLRGKSAIPRAKEALQALEEHEIPYVLLTNGGGYTERAKAQSISDILGHHIDPQSLALAHSPFRTLVDEYDFRHKPVLVVGKSRVHQIAWEYGFENVFDVGDLHHQWPGLFPDWSPLPKCDEFERIDPSVCAKEHMLRPLPRDVHAPRTLTEPLACVLTFMDPQHYHRDLQILTDVIRFNGFPGLRVEATSHACLGPAEDATASALLSASEGALLPQAASLAFVPALAADATDAGATASFTSTTFHSNDPAPHASAAPKSAASVRTGGCAHAHQRSGTDPASTGEKLPVFFAGPDMEYVTDWHAPRFGSGVFAAALTHLYNATCATDIRGASGLSPFEGRFVGKPHPMTYRYAETLFETLTQTRFAGALGRETSLGGVVPTAPSSTHGRRRVYMVGDNPKSDIRGALNQGWHAILVRSGMFTGSPGSNDPEHPANAVVDDVMDAVEYIISCESQNAAPSQ